MPNPNLVDLHLLLTPEAIRVNLPGATKEDIIDGLVALLDGSPGVQDLERVRKAVFEREAMMSTGVGKGLALPHAKTDAVRETRAAFAVTAEPVDFDSIDNRPVRLVFLLVGPESAKSQHIKLLSRVSRLMNRDKFRDRLLAARSPGEVIDIFRDGEEQYLEG